MNDPFSPQAPIGYYDPNSSPSAGIGNPVLDAPDHTLRMIDTKVRLGQPLTPHELSRQATRQAVEQQTALENRNAGQPMINMGRSIDGQGTAMGNAMALADAHVRAAQMAAQPVFEAQEQMRAHAMTYGMGSINPNDPSQALALANVTNANDRARNNGTTVQQELMRSQIAPAMDQPTAVESGLPARTVSDPNKADTGTSRALDAFNSTEKVHDPDVLGAQRLYTEYGHVPYMSVGQMSDARVAMRKDTEGMPSEVSVTDPLSQNVYSLNVNRDSKGNVVRVNGDPTLKSAGPFKQLDDEAQKDYNDWVVNGDREKSHLSLKNLVASATKLGTPDGNTASGPFVSMLPTFLRKRFTPTGVDVRVGIENEAMKGMKAIFGARITNVDLVNTLARTFDETLPPEINAARVKKLAEVIAVAAKAKDASSEYFRLHQTLGQYAGPKTMTLDQAADEVINSTSSPTANAVAPPSAPVSKYMSKFAPRG